MRAIYSVLGTLLAEGGANLRGANLHGADLHGADLQWAPLRWADLRWANLQGADLHGADLQGADLRWADLHGADLQGADLYGADLHGADLYGERLTKNPIVVSSKYWVCCAGQWIQIGCQNTRRHHGNDSRMLALRKWLKMLWSGGLRTKRGCWQCLMPRRISRAQLSPPKATLAHRQLRAG